MDFCLKRGVGPPFKEYVIVSILKCMLLYPFPISQLQMGSFGPRDLNIITAFCFFRLTKSVSHFCIKIDEGLFRKSNHAPALTSRTPHIKLFFFKVVLTSISSSLCGLCSKLRLNANQLPASTQRERKIFHFFTVTFFRKPFGLM